MARKPAVDAPPESDCFELAPHPRRADAFLGNREAERELLEAYRSGHAPHAWIFGGPQGVGKATLAWRFAKFALANPDPSASAVRAAADLATQAEHPAVRRLALMTHGDIALLRREWNDKARPKPRHFLDIRVDDVRAAIERFRRVGEQGGWRICVIDSLDDLNASSANALLKIVEEPPPRSLFLMIAHRPGRVLATLRSRSRMLRLDRLSEDEIAATIRTLPASWSAQTPETIAVAAARANGSVREALRLLKDGGLAFVRRLEEALERLPRVDWGAAQTIADALGRRENEDDFNAFLTCVYDWLDRQARRGGPARGRIGFAEAWDKIAFAARESEALNLDRRALVLAAFEDLAEAAARR